MEATVQSKTYFPGSMTDLNKSFYNGDWNQYHNGKSQKISGPGNGQHYDYFLMAQAMDGCSGYGKEHIRQTILKHESVFKHQACFFFCILLTSGYLGSIFSIQSLEHMSFDLKFFLRYLCFLAFQLQELHRLYKRQRDLMNPVLAETSNLGRYLSHLPSDISKGTHIFASSVPLVDSSFDNPFSPIGSIKGKSTSNHFGPVSSKNGFSERRVIDLGTKYLAEEPPKRGSSAKRTLFGVEISESKHTPSILLPWKNTTCVQNLSAFHRNNHWLHSSDLTSQNPGFVADHSRLSTSSTRQDSSTGFAFLYGINSKDALSNSREEIYAQKKHTFLDMWKNRDTPQQTLPSWLTAKPCLQNEQIKPKETPIHHSNLNSSQNQSQHFFKKTETTEGKDELDFKKLKINNSQTITKIPGVPIIDKQVESHCEAKDIRHHIDLNLSLDEEDSPSSFPESVVKIATMEIDLDAPAVESDTDSGSMDNTHTEIVKIAAEAIVSISISQPPGKPSSDTLMWFAEIITCNNLEKSSKAVSEDMDYFEYMTLKLEDTKESYNSYKAITVEKEEEQKENDSGSLTKRTARKGQGKDFQNDILSGIVSLSRREVTEDTGVTWQSSLSKRKAAARNGRGKRRLVVPDTSCNPPTPPVGVEKSICREMSLDKSVGGRGRRTRRLPRQR